MARKKEGNPQGLLYPTAGERNFQLARYLPAEDLKFFIEHYWRVQWDLRGQEPYRSENLPYPSVHLVIEKDKSGIFGVTRGKFTRLLEGRGYAFAIKFRPGGFYPFVNSPVSRFTDRSTDLSEVFGPVGKSLETAILAAADDERRIELAGAFLRARHPFRDERVEMVNEAIEHIAAQPNMTRVDDLAHQFNLTKRTLERLFSRYVGISPSWVIRRYRLYEATDRLDKGEIVDWPRLAADLGYFDQAHFIKDFKKITGVSPGEYTRLLSPGEKLKVPPGS
jgi:AraC-like DNA-binding protein